MIGNKYLKPSFLIIGGVKCGSSSLYRYLNEHPNVLPCKTKEPDFWAKKKYYKLLYGLGKYYALFPEKNKNKTIVADWISLDKEGKIQPEKITKERDQNKTYITGEATATTYFKANPKWVKRILPNVRTIMLVRNPTDRLYSHFQMYVRLTNQGKRSFRFNDFDLFVDTEIEKHHKGEKTVIQQGKYIDILKDWSNTFGENQFKIFHMNDFSEAIKGQKNMDIICDYLSLDHFDFSPYLQKKHNKASYNPMPANTKNT